MIYKDYFTKIEEILNEVANKEENNILEAADVIAKSIEGDGVIHVFGCGHSQMYAMELFYRAGGLVPVNAILPPALSLAPTAPISTFAERQEGLAKLILDKEMVHSQDVMIVISTSGRNPVPIEMAQEAANRGLKVIVLTSLEFSKKVSSRAKDGEKLYQLADVILDNHGVSGDAIMEAPGMSTKFGPTSSIVGFTILQSVVAQVIDNLNEKGITPPIYVSSNLDEGDAINKQHIENYRSRITCL